MSLKTKLKNRPRTTHSEVRLEHADGSVDVVRIVRATFADRQSVFAAATKGNWLDKDNQPTSIEAGLSLGALVISRLLYQGNERVFGDSQEDMTSILELDQYEDLAALAMQAFVGEDTKETKND